MAEPAGLKQAANRQDWLNDVLAQHEGPLLRYVLRLTGNLERARDIVQDAFVRLCQEREKQDGWHGRPGGTGVPPVRVEKYGGASRGGDRPARDPNNHPAEWLYAVCRNRAIDIHRKERRMKTLTLVETEPTPVSPSPAESAEQRDTASAALRLLATLPENQQEVVRLKFSGGLSYKEISRVTGLSVSNVGFLIHTALKTLREQMATGADELPVAKRRLS